MAIIPPSRCRPHKTESKQQGRLKRTRFYAIITVAGLLVAIAPAQRATAQLCLQLIGGTQSENFDGLAVSGTSNTVMPIGFAFAEVGSGANITYAAGDGSSSTGNTYSFGMGTNTDRALGEITSGAVQSNIGACFTNSTNAPISWFAIKYTGEQWRLGEADATSDRLNFQYSLNATSLNNGTWMDYDALDFVSPNNAGAAGALNGNAVANRTVFPMTAIELATPVPPGGTFYIRWQPLNISGNNDGLAIDDFSITVASGPPACPADITRNGTVNVDDLLAVINGWGACH